MIGDDDLETIFENGDFDTTAVFTISTGPTVTLDVKGWFTAASQGVSMMSNVEVEAAKPSFTCPTADIATVRNKMSVVIDSVTYQVEKVEPVGTGVSVVWLKTT